MVDNWFKLSIILKTMINHLDFLRNKENYIIYWWDRKTSSFFLYQWIGPSKINMTSRKKKSLVILVKLWVLIGWMRIGYKQMNEIIQNLYDHFIHIWISRHRKWSVTNWNWEWRKKNVLRDQHYIAYKKFSNLYSPHNVCILHDCFVWMISNS